MRLPMRQLAWLPTVVHTPTARAAHELGSDIPLPDIARRADALNKLALDDVGADRLQAHGRRGPVQLNREGKALAIRTTLGLHEDELLVEEVTPAEPEHEREQDVVRNGGEHPDRGPDLGHSAHERIHVQTLGGIYNEVSLAHQQGQHPQRARELQWAAGLPADSSRCQR
jgi:hypothetical protein